MRDIKLKYNLWQKLKNYQEKMNNFNKENNR